MGFYLEEVAGYIVPNVWGVWVFSGIIYWAVGKYFEGLDKVLGDFYKMQTVICMCTQVV